jgi:hypothetical protein
MKIERPRRVVVALLLLAGGFAVAMLRPSPEGGASLSIVGTLWESRRADLIVQLGLMLVGALGIRALLPGDHEGAEEEHADDSLH